MKREILFQFQGRENVTHIISDNGTESYLTQSHSFGDETYFKGASGLNTVENEKKHVLFLFNDKAEEVGRYYLGKKLQGKTPSELVALKDSLAFFETWNPESKSWVPCVGLSSNAPDPKTSLRKITISKPIVNKRSDDNTSDIKASLKKHELSFMLFDKDTEFYCYSLSDKSLQWGYKKDDSFYNNNAVVIGYSDALNIQNPEEMVHYYIDDLKTLPSIVKLLGERADECQLVDKMNINLLKSKLEKSIEKIKEADDKKKHSQQ